MSTLPTPEEIHALWAGPWQVYRCGYHGTGLFGVKLSADNGDTLEIEGDDPGGLIREAMAWKPLPAFPRRPAKPGPDPLNGGEIVKVGGEWALVTPGRETLYRGAKKTRKDLREALEARRERELAACERWDREIGPILPGKPAVDFRWAD